MTNYGEYEYDRTEYIQLIRDTLLMCGRSDLHALSVLTGFSIDELNELGGLDDEW